jgi:oxygen-dependent protoporphyrinogen oxidase
MQSAAEGVPRDRGRAGRPGAHVVVVGAGIAGLAAAWALVHEPEVAQVTVLESAARVGGKLALGEVAGMPVDTGAGTLLPTGPEAVDLAAAVGLGAALETQAEQGVSVLVEGRLRAMPSATVMGVPTDLTALARTQILDATALARLPLDHVLPLSRTGDDVAVANHVGHRLGPQPVTRLVGPLLVATYAGDVTAMSMRATMPELFSAAQTERSLLAAAKAVHDKAAGSKAPPVGIAGGVGRLPGELCSALQGRGVTVRTSAAVRGLARRGDGWQVTFGSAADPERLDADGVVLAVPAHPAARLLDGLAIGACVQLGEIEYASVATVTLAYRAVDLSSAVRLGVAAGSTEQDGPPGPDASGGLAAPARGGAAEEAGLGGGGFLVGLSEPRSITSATCPSRRWRWLGDIAEPEGLAVLQASIGTTQDVGVLQRDDDDLVAIAHTDLGFALRLGRAAPVAATVARWGAALPQYAVGHVDRVHGIRDSIAMLPAIAVCGAAYDGVGIGACIASGARAAREVVAGLASVGPG